MRKIDTIRKTLKNQHGQAIMEMMVMIIAVVVCMVGVLAVVGLGIGNIDLLMCGKTTADLKAYNQVRGYDGREIHTWRYTVFDDKKNKVEIPFLVKDAYSRQADNLVGVHAKLNDENYSDAEDTSYLFNNYSVFTDETGINFANTETYFSAAAASNLHEGACSAVSGCCNKCSSCSSSSMYQVLSILLNGEIDISRLEKAQSNKVYIPSMKIREEIK